MIIGAGPAGSSLAQRLGREGLSVALVEARRFPRAKPCGEFVGPEALRLLADLDLQDPVGQLGARPIGGLTLRVGSRAVTGHFRVRDAAGSAGGHGLGARREVLDEALLQGALATGNVEWICPWRAVRLEREHDGTVSGVVVRSPEGDRRTLRALFTVGADGLYSVVARDLGVRRQRAWLNRVGLSARYALDAPSSEAQVVLRPDGFVAAAPVSARLWTVNLVVDSTSLARRPSSPAQVLEREARQDAFLGDLLQGAKRATPVHGAGPLSWRTTQQVFDGAALVGDASGYVDPLTGDGIHLALRGSALLATCLCDAVRSQRNDREALSSYARARRAEIAPRERLGLLLTRASRHPRLVESALRLLGRRTGLVDLAVRLKAGGEPLRSLLRS